MTRRTKNALAQACLLGALAAAAIYGYSLLAKAKRRAMDAAEDLRATRHAADLIKASRDTPALVGLHEIEHLELSRGIESAAQSAGIAAGEIDSIDPSPPRQLGNSPYKEKPTEVRLRQATLQQLITFLHRLSTGPAGLTVKNLRLAAPHELDKPDLWKVEVTLTYLLYSPLETPQGSIK